MRRKCFLKIYLAARWLYSISLEKFRLSEQFYLYLARKKFLYPKFPYFEGLNANPKRLLDIITWNNAIGFEIVVETGTFEGATTYLFSIVFQNATIYTSETNRLFYDKAKKKLKHKPNVQQYLMDSGDMLRKNQVELINKRTFFYLDAHWGSNLPILDELDICLKGKHAMIMIDDFRVPHDAGFGYDSYGDLGVLELDFISQTLAKHKVDIVYFPRSVKDYPAGKTGRKLYDKSIPQGISPSRGFIIITKDKAMLDSLENMPHLIRHTLC